MINLLPNEYKLHLRYGRLNVRLTRWLGAGILIIAALAVILGVGWLYMGQEIRDLNGSIATSQAQLKSQDLGKVKGQADEISQNVKIINQVLRSEIRFSSLIQEVGRAMPRGTVLTSLGLSDEVSGGLDLKALAKDSTAAAQVAVNLSDPRNNLFSQVDILGVDCSFRGQDYPCSIELRVLFDDATSKKFINVPEVGENQ